MHYTEMFSAVKIENFIRKKKKKKNIFDIFAQNIDFGLSGHVRTVSAMRF